jgi:hypothetical protein
MHAADSAVRLVTYATDSTLGLSTYVYIYTWNNKILITYILQTLLLNISCALLLAGIRPSNRGCCTFIHSGNLSFSRTFCVNWSATPHLIFLFWCGWFPCNNIYPIWERRRSGLLGLLGLGTVSSWRMIFRLCFHPHFQLPISNIHICLSNKWLIFIIVICANCSIFFMCHLLNF